MERTTYESRLATENLTGVRRRARAADVHRGSHAAGHRPSHELECLPSGYARGKGFGKVVEVFRHRLSSFLSLRPS
jgi:hypothetical protein